MFGYHVTIVSLSFGRY